MKCMSFLFESDTFILGTMRRNSLNDILFEEISLNMILCFTVNTLHLKLHFVRNGLV